MIKEKDNMRLLIELRDQNLPNDSLALTNNDSTQWSVGTATSVRAKFFVLNEKRTIREIIDSTLLPAHVVVGLLPQSSSSLLAKPYVPFGAATKLYSNGQELYRVDTSDPHRFTKALMCPYGLHALIRSFFVTRPICTNLLRETLNRCSLPDLRSSAQRLSRSCNSFVFNHLKSSLIPTPLRINLLRRSSCINILRFHRWALHALLISHLAHTCVAGWEAGSMRWMGDGLILSVRMKTRWKDGEDGRLAVPFNPI
uniref:Uncharacterized protein n=1 Tax=Brassica campestris TaxID=3711 RepID=M4FGS5_BRACM|nr:unnamed protein product [Brassica rapa]